MAASLSRATLVAIAVMGLAAPGARAALGYEPDSSLSSIALHGDLPHGVAIDQASKRLYVTELTADSVAQKPGQVEQLELTGVPTAASPFTVSDSEAAFGGVAVNPLTHGIYATQFTFPSPFGTIGHSRMDQFSAGGAPGLEFSVQAAVSKAVQIATDSSGNVYFPNTVANVVQVFDSSGASLETISCTGCPGGGFATPYGIAVSPAGSLYVVDIGSDRVVRFNRSGGSYVYDSILQSGRGAASVGVDPSDGTVFVGDLAENVFHIVAYNSVGVQTDDFGSGLFASSPYGNLSAGQIAVDESTHKVYVSDAGNETVHVFARVTINPPTATTEPASNVGQVSAQLNASVNPRFHAVTHCEFDYVDDADFQANGYANASSIPCSSLPTGSTPSPVHATPTGLATSTAYHFRVVAENNAGATTGSGGTFTTLPMSAASVTTEAATAITQTTAKLVGKVNPHGGSVSDCDFEYGHTQSYGSSVPCATAVGPVTTDVAQTLEASGLSAKTTYHYRLTVTTNAGEVNGNDEEFTTLPPPPSVTTQPASGVTQTAATLAGSIDPNGSASSCHFQYGKTIAYGSSAECPQDPGGGISAVAESLELSGLEPSTTYHYRLVGVNAGGTVNGLDQSFTTQQPTPPAIPPEQSPPPPPAPPTSVKPPPLKCKKGFRKLRVRGKLRCVRKKRRRRR